MQVMAKHHTVSEAAEAHEELAKRVCADGVVTPTEQAELMCSARRLVRVAIRQGLRIRFAVRMINGGEFDRHFDGDVRDYRRLCQQEKAASQWKCNAA